MSFMNKRVIIHLYNANLMFYSRQYCNLLYKLYCKNVSTVDLRHNCLIQNDESENILKYNIHSFPSFLLEGEIKREGTVHFGKFCDSSL